MNTQASPNDRPPLSNLTNQSLRDFNFKQYKNLSPEIIYYIINDVGAVITLICVGCCYINFTDF